MAYVEELAHGPYNFEVRVRAISGQTFHYYMDKFAMIGDVKQRLSKELGRKFHEMKLVSSSTSPEPDMFEKVSSFRTRGGIVDLALVINRTCRWCNLQLMDPPPNPKNPPLYHTEIGDFCGKACYAIMQRELQDPWNTFYVFGVSSEQEQLHLPYPYVDPDRRPGY